jgi:hypothetical protein
MRYQYCDTQKKYRTVMKQLKSRYIDTSYSKKNCVKDEVPVLWYAEKVPYRNENSLKHGTMITAQFSSVIPLCSEPYQFLQY